MNNAASAIKGACNAETPSRQPITPIIVNADFKMRWAFLNDEWSSAFKSGMYRLIYAAAEPSREQSIFHLSI